jgi:tripartite-type tricarboxylate transporter receptor subunit TctC
MRYTTSTLVFATLALLTSAVTVQAQSQPIRLIVPYSAGGPLDVTARLLAERVRDTLGTVIVDNRPGAGGNIGANAVAKAAPDGLTIGIAATATHAVNPWLYRKMPYNAASDFAPITQMVRVPNVLVMNAEAAQRLKINTLADLIAYAKANPAKLNYGSGGNGSAGHLAGELLKKPVFLRYTFPTTAVTRHNWPCSVLRSTSTLTTSPRQPPISAQAN